MSQQYDNTNSGALFVNNRKTSDRQPDYKGNLNVEGTEYWVSAWVKTSRGGQDYLSVSLTPKDAQQQNQNSGSQARTLGRTQPQTGSAAPREFGDDDNDFGPAFPSEASGMDDCPF